MQIHGTNRGMTLIEILIAIAIIGILGTVTFGALSPSNDQQLLRGATDRVVSVLADARARTLAASDDQQYGVHFDTDQVVLFVGDTYTAGAAGNEVEKLPRRVSITSIALADGGSEVVFARLTGAASTDGEIVLELAASPPQQRTITIDTSGIVSQ